jgi:hypothetical protein
MMEKKLKKKLKWCIKKMHLTFMVSFIRNYQFNRRVARFYTQFLKKGDVYFDVGANHGNRISPIIKHIRRRGGKIIAVEPQAECVAFLKEKFGNKITIVPKGLGEHEGELVMAISNDNRLSSFSTEWVEATQKKQQVCSYECRVE